MAVRKVVLKGHKALTTENKKITGFNSPKLTQVIKDLRDTLRKSTLVGIAAPQIGENYKIFITCVRNTKYRNFGKEDKLRVFINPEIKFLSKKEVVIYEGCGSVVNDEGFPFGPVLRSKEIEVEAFDEKGKKFSFRCDGILARIIQHEMDHLNGIEFLEKVKDSSRIVSEEFYKKTIKNSKEQLQTSIITKVEYKTL
jgi:peptide deformylase